MESDEYMRILDTITAYRRALKAYPAQWDVIKHD